MARTPEQRNAAAENWLNREKTKARNKSRSLDAGQKIVIGGVMLNAARRDEKFCAWLCDLLDRSVEREADRRRIQPLIDELRGRKDAGL